MQSKTFSFKKFRHYTDIFKTLIVDSVWRFKGRSFLVLIAGVLGVVFQVQAIALALYYAKVIEQGENISHLGYSIDPRTSMWFLFFAGAGVLLSLMLSAWLNYFSRTEALRLMRKYTEVCTLRIFKLFAANFRGLTTEEDGLSSDVTVLKLAGKDAKCCGRSLRLILKAVVPIITFLVAIISLLYINVLLTLVIFIFISVSVFFQYKVSVQGARDTSLVDKYSKAASSGYRNIIKSQKATAVPIITNSQISENILTSRKVNRFHDAFEGRLKALENSRFISDVLFGIAVFAIMIMLGSSIILKGAGWGRLVIYLVALRYMMVNLKQSVSMITSINRFFPHLKRYFGFLHNIDARSVSGGSTSKSYPITVDGKLLNCIENRWEVNRGSRIGLISSVDLNRYTVAYLTDSLLGPTPGASGNALESMWFVILQEEDLLLGIRDSFGLPLAYNRTDLQKDLEGSGLQEKFGKQVPHDLEQTINPDQWRKIDPDIKFALNLLSAIHSDAQLIMIEEAGLHLLSDNDCEFFLKRLSDRIVVIVFSKDLSGAGRYKEEIIAVVDTGKTIGLGTVDWIRENSHVIFSTLSQSTASRSKGTQKDDIDDEDDDEDEI